MLGAEHSDIKRSSISGASGGKKAYYDPYLGQDLGRYQIDEIIGTGGWGNVYRATDLSDGTTVAIKIVHKHHLQDESSIKRFELEAKSLGKVQNRYVVKILGYGFEPAPYIVMEHFEGISLSQWLKQNGPMKPRMAIDLFMQLCEGMSTTESMNIIHRDLKPSNILLKIDDENLEAKILDFGLAKFTDQSTLAESLTSTGEILGSPPYMSPEHWKGQCDLRSDIYSLGCIMYEVLTGRPPFLAQFGIDYMSKHITDKAPRISEVNISESFPEALEDVVSKCLQKNPSKRYQSSNLCAIDLGKIKYGISPGIIILDHFIAKHNKLIALAATFLLLVLAAIVLFKDDIVHYACSRLYAESDTDMALGRTRSAIGNYRTILELSQFLPEKDLQKLRALRVMEAYYRQRKQFDRALTFERKIDALIGRINSDPDMAMLASQIQRTIDAKNIDQAENLAHFALKMAETKLGKHSMAYAACLNYVGSFSFSKGAYGEAAECYRQSLAISKDLLEPQNFRIPEIMDHLSISLKHSGQMQEAEDLAKASKQLKADNKNQLAIKVPKYKKQDLVLWDFPDVCKTQTANAAVYLKSISPQQLNKSGKIALLSDKWRY